MLTWIEWLNRCGDTCSIFNVRPTSSMSRPSLTGQTVLVETIENGPTDKDLSFAWWNAPT